MKNASISDNIAKLLNRVRLEAKKSQRSAGDICIVAASKTRSGDEIRAAHRAGIVNFGENYLQEALDKIDALTDLDLCWHFIGPLQSNKTRPVAKNFSWVHSVERIKIARRLSLQRPADMAPLQICLQVNISGEANKSGATPAELPQLVKEIATLENITLRGLMAIPAATQDRHQQTLAFSEMRQLLQQLQLIDPTLDTLSMGMSSDLEAAIAQGSTLIRVGTDIFGPRER